MNTKYLIAAAFTASCLFASSAFAVDCGDLPVSQGQKTFSYTGPAGSKAGLTLFVAEKFKQGDSYIWTYGYTAAPVACWADAGSSCTIQYQGCASTSAPNLIPVGLAQLQTSFTKPETLYDYKTSGSSNPWSAPINQNWNVLVNATAGGQVGVTYN